MDEISYVVEHGQRSRNAGTLAFFLGKRDIPSHDQKNQRIAQLEGLTVQTDSLEDGTLLVITLYRNRDDGLKDHRRKTKFDRRRNGAA